MGVQLEGMHCGSNIRASLTPILKAHEGDSYLVAAWLIGMKICLPGMQRLQGKGAADGSEKMERNAEEMSAKVMRLVL